MSAEENGFEIGSARTNGRVERHCMTVSDNQKFRPTTVCQTNLSLEYFNPEKFWTRPIRCSRFQRPNEISFKGFVGLRHWSLWKPTVGNSRAANTSHDQHRNYQTREGSSPKPAKADGSFEQDVSERRENY